MFVYYGIKDFFFFFRNKISSQLLILLGNTKNHIMSTKEFFFFCSTDRLKLTQSGDEGPNKNPTEIKIILFKKLVAAGRQHGKGVSGPQRKVWSLHAGAAL